jgi:hypothetical protein
MRVRLTVRVTQEDSSTSRKPRRNKNYKKSRGNNQKRDNNSNRKKSRRNKKQKQKQLPAPTESMATQSWDSFFKNCQEYCHVLEQATQYLLRSYRR